MTDFSSNDPSSFGWTAPPSSVEPFAFRGQQFPQGLHPLAVPIFTEALSRLCAVPGFELHPGPPMVAGDWGYEARDIINNPGTLSFHAYAIAIDVNAPWNPQGQADPAPSPYRIGDQADELVRPLGILWGGSPEFGSNPDRMHFELHLSPAQCGRPGPIPTPAPSRYPFPLPPGWYYGPLSGPDASVSGAGPSDGPYRPGLERVQRLLGVSPDGLYGPITAAATRAFQQRHGLVVDGLIGILTWTSLLGR